MNIIKRKLYAILGLYKPERIDEEMDQPVVAVATESSFQTTLDHFGINPDPIFSWEDNQENE